MLNRDHLSSKFNFIALTFLGAFILMIFALYDGYPIVTSDTGSYISSGFTLSPPDDRPIFYGIFIHLTSFGASLWLTVFVQCFLLSYLLINFFKVRIPSISHSHLIGLVSIISLLTIGGWYAGQIMPDIFVSIMMLGVINYLLQENTKSQNIIILTIIFLSTLLHNSNYIIITLFSCIIIFGSFFKSSLKIFRRKIFNLLAISILAWLSLCMSNYAGGKGFITSNSTHVFIMGKLVESGVLKTYLDKACPIKNYKICAYKDSLPAVAWEFHWDATSPLQKTGGWDANREEYNTIIKDILSRPKYYPFLAFKSMEATARQLTLLNIDGSYALPWTVFDAGTSPFENIYKYYPHELNEFKNSRQNIKTFNISFLNSVFSIFFLFSSLVCLFCIPKAFSKEAKILYAITLSLIILNAFTTATLSSVNERLNSRVIWLLPLINLYFIYKMLSLFLKTKPNFNEKENFCNDDTVNANSKR